MQHLKTIEKQPERVFGFQDSTVRKICKATPFKKTNKWRLGGFKRSNNFKGNKK